VRAESKLQSLAVSYVKALQCASKYAVPATLSPSPKNGTFARIVLVSTF